MQKSFFYNFGVLTVVIIDLCLSFSGYVFASTFTVSSSGASNVASDFTIVNGSIDNLGSATSSTFRGFKYGLTNSYLLGTTNEGNQNSSSPGGTPVAANFNTGLFTAEFSGLTCNTTYHYEAIATSSSASIATSSDQSFTTGACATLMVTKYSTPYNTAYSNVSMTLPGWDYYTQLNYTTNENATCKYATSSATTYNALSMSADTSGTSHVIYVPYLVPNTSYVYYPYCKDGSGNYNSTTTSALTFNVAAPPGPAFEYLGPKFTYFNAVIIRWSTTEQTNTLLNWGTSSSSLTNTLPSATDTSMSVTHGVTITGLSPGTTYYYQVVATDKGGLSSSSPVQSFTTLSTSYAIQYYVSTTGSDTNNGTSSTTPFATLSKAQTTASTWISANGGSCTTPVMIWLLPGEFYESAAFSLSVSGKSSTCPIVYSGYSGNQTAVLSGGKSVTGWAPITSSDHIYSHFGVSAQANIYEVNLNSLGISDYGNFSGLPTTEGGSVTTAPLELIWNGKLMTLAQFPNYNSASTSAGFVTSTANGTTIGYNYNGTRDGTACTWGWQIGSSTNPVEVHGWFADGYADSWGTVSSYSGSGSSCTITVNQTVSQYSNSNMNGGYFYFADVASALDTPGEYYMDRATGILYFWPPTNISQGTAEVTTENDNLIDVGAVSNVMFQNMTFENTRVNAFYVNNNTPPSNFFIADSVIRNIGHDGFNTEDKQETQVGIYDSHFEDIGQTPVYFYYSTDGNLDDNWNMVVDDKIEGFGELESMKNGHGSGVFQYGPDNLYISHNNFSQAYGSAVDLFMSNNSDVEYNSISNVLGGAADYGTIYMNNGIDNRGNIAKYNYIHNITSVKQVANGIYFDDSSPDDKAYGNILFNVEPNRMESAGDSGAFMIGGGKNTIIDNNIIVDTLQPIWFGWWNNATGYKSMTPDTQTYTSPNNVLYPEATLVMGAQGTTNDTDTSEGSAVVNDIFYTSTPMFVNAPDAPINEAQIDMHGNVSNTDINSNSVNSVVADPLFSNLAGGSFALQSGSPALALGFQPLPDISQMNLINPNDPVFQESGFSSGTTTPSVTTSPATSVSTSTITFNGSIIADGGASSTIEGFAYGTSSTLTDSGVSTTTSLGTFGVSSFSTTTVNLLPNTLYYFRAYAVNSAGTSTGSILSTTTLAITVPGAPTGVTVVAGNAQATVSFATPLNNGGSPILYYTASSSPGNITGTSTSSPITVFGLTDGTPYTFIVTATNIAGTSTVSSASNSVIASTTPSLTTSPATSVGTSIITWNGSITFDGGASSTAEGFVYGTSSTLTGSSIATTSISGTFGVGSFSTTTLNLLTNTNYYFEAFATNALGTSYGSILSTTTLTVAVPTLTTSVATSVSTSTAALNANISSLGGTLITQSGFAYCISSASCTSTNLGTGTATTTLGAQGSTGPFSQSLTGLTANETYYFRAYAVNSAGTSTGSIKSFNTTDTNPPKVSMTLPTSGSTVNGSSVSLAATSTDDVGVVGVQFLLDGTTNIGSLITSTSSPNTYTTTWDSTGITIYGSHTIYAVAHDAAGNYATSTVGVIVDNVKPNLVSAVYNTVNQTITVGLSTTTNSATITKSNNGGFTVTQTGSPGTTYSVYSIAPGSDNAHIVLTTADMTTAGGSGVIVTYTAGGNGTIADPLGNLMATNSTGITIPPWDTVAPIISNITSTVPNGAYTVGTAIDVDLTFSEQVNSTGSVLVTLNTGGTCSFTVSDSNIASCTYTVQSGDNASPLNISSVAGTIISTTGNTMTSFVPALNLDANTNIIVDTAAPSVTWLSPSAGATVSSTSVVLSATASDAGSGIAGVQFILDGTTDIGSEDTTNP